MSQPMRVHLNSTDKVNHLTNHPLHLQTNRHHVVNDQGAIHEYLERFLADELEAKGLNFATTHYLNASGDDPVQRLAAERLLAHSFREGTSNFLIDHFCSEQTRSKVDPRERFADDDRELNRMAKERVAVRRQQQADLDKIEREELKRQLYNMYFKMKEVVKNLNDDNPTDPFEFSEEKKLEIVDAMRKHLLPRPTRKKEAKDEPSAARLKCKSVREYMMVRSDELKEVIYEDIFFEENVNKNQNDDIMKQLAAKLEPENYEQFKKIGGKKTKEFMRLLITRQLMMKEERDRVIMKRLLQKKLEEKEEEELRRILNNYQRKEDKKLKKIAVVPRLPEEKGHSRDNLSSGISQFVNSYHDQTSIMDTVGGGGRDRKTTTSSLTNLDMPRNAMPKKRVETIQRFDVPHKKNEEPSTKNFVRIKEKTEVFEIPSKESNRKSGSKGRFRKKEHVDNRNDLLKQHEENMRKASSILNLGQARQAIAH